MPENNLSQSSLPKTSLLLIIPIIIFGDPQTATASTIDSKETELFGKYGETWWNNSEFQTLFSMNKLRVPFIKDALIHAKTDKHDFANQIKKPLEGFKILDVGCGGGFLSEPLAKLGAYTVGIDVTPELIEAANLHKELNKEVGDNLRYEYTSIEEFSLENANKFDAVVASEVIEHVYNKSEFVKHCVASLKPGGSIIFTTISKTVLSKIVAIFIAENVINLLPKGTHEFEKFVSPYELQNLLRKNNCTTKRIRGLGYNPLLNKWCWIPWTGVSYALHAVKVY